MLALKRRKHSVLKSQSKLLVPLQKNFSFDIKNSSTQIYSRLSIFSAPGLNTKTDELS